ncbi:MAG: hypothetical protein JSR45_18500 [Proteobacteria bacterium]|nr:hypothetical protein [Pseudomonadota bacterium]
MFRGWENFYLTIGSAAGALIGLLFVVVTLTAGRDRQSALRGVSLYMTPTVLHFVTVLCASAVVTAPGLPLWLLVALIALAVAVGFGNCVWAALGIRGLRQASEPVHWTDFWMYGVTPAGAYLLLGLADAFLLSRSEWAPRFLAAVLMGLLLCGIRNAWDLVTWIAPGRPDPNSQMVVLPPTSEAAPKPRPRKKAAS